jgi:lysophospholipase L1-like esterase
VGAAGNPWKILPLGDSITHGFNVLGGYRAPLWRLCADAGLAIRFVGSEDSGPTSLPERAHEGHNGWRIDHLDVHAAAWVRRFQPDIVLLLAGANDVWERDIPDAVAARLALLIDHVLGARPGVIVVVGTLTPWSGRMSDAYVRQVNERIPAIAASRPSVRVADLYRAMTVDDLADEVHPNAAGHDKIARTFFAALRDVAAEKG